MCTRSPFFQTAFRNINTFIPVIINEWAKKTKKKKKKKWRSTYEHLLSHPWINVCYNIEKVTYVANYTNVLIHLIITIHNYNNSLS
jgi:hypothetical protein